ncbi:uncharacterized protein [Lolium perenne]|uniref:uncharacterized protein isoform X1 n=2 Tax=Lolium perenne TaxID=4522 RepID=UPI0021F6456D|nr:uncharacterized protein LOC127321187 isoform X1 [Lolium perenne]
MSSLLRSPATRRALSAVSTRGPQGASFRRAPSVAAPAFGEEWGATVRRGLAFPTLPRRHLGGPPLPGVEATTPSPAQVDQLRQSMKQLKDTLDKGFVIYGSVRLVVEDCKPEGAFRQWSRLYGAILLLLLVERMIKS